MNSYGICLSLTDLLGDATLNGNSEGRSSKAGDWARTAKGQQGKDDWVALLTFLGRQWSQ